MQNPYPRQLAVHVLTRVWNDKIFLEAALEGVSREARPWLQEVCSGTLRWQGRLELVLDSVSLKKKPTGWLRKILLLAIYQLIAQDRTKPAHVIFETVEEVKNKEGLAPSRFANAVLRKVLDHAQAWKTVKLEDKNPKSQFQRGSLPKWLWEKLIDQYSVDFAWNFALASLERPKLWVCSQKDSPGSHEAEKEILESAEFRDGKIIVQDISNQTLVREVSEMVQKSLGKKDLTALDLCACPGGKTVGLAWNGFRLSSSDKDAHKISILKETLERTHLDAQVKVIEKKDLKNLPLQDLVWVDPPCTGTGILRRHPEIRWHKKEEDLKALTKLQFELLREGWEKVSPGGFLAYSVCSVLKEEGEGILKNAGFLQAHAKTLKEWFLSPHLEPCGDGFWAVLIQKEYSH